MLVMQPSYVIFDIAFSKRLGISSMDDAGNEEPLTNIITS